MPYTNIMQVPMKRCLELTPDQQRFEFALDDKRHLTENRSVQSGVTFVGHDFQIYGCAVSCSTGTDLKRLNIGVAGRILHLMSVMFATVRNNFIHRAQEWRFEQS
jgi:hypothetical protein